MTKGKLLATASVAALALTFATSAYAGSNVFGNRGETEVKIYNNNDGGHGGDGGNASATSTGGAGGAGGAGGSVVNTVNANSGNSYIKIEAKNEQSNSMGGGLPDGEQTLILLGGGGAKIDTSGGSNHQDGGNASSYAKSETNPDNTAKVYANGGEGETGRASSETSADRKAYHSGDASGANGDVTGGSATSGNGTGGTGGGTNQANANTTGGAAGGNTTTGGSTSGAQNANGGAVSGGVMTVSGLGSAAGAFAFNLNTGNIAQGNAANAIAAHVGTINNIVPPSGGGGG